MRATGPANTTATPAAIAQRILAGARSAISRFYADPVWNRTCNGTGLGEERTMDEHDFKRHLKDLAHGHHHPEEHDWAEPQVRADKPARKRTVRTPSVRKKRK